MRTVVSSVTFKRAFTLPGFDRPHAPGTFQVRTNYERLDTILEAWRRTETTILIVDRGLTQSWGVDPRELDKAVLADAEVEPAP